MEKNKIYHGNNLDILRTFEDNSIDSIVTDPPYGISFMNKKWDYDVPTVEFWREALRVLKPGGHALVACGTRTQHRMAVNLEDAGFEIRDIVAWVYGSGFPKSRDIAKDIEKKQVGGIKNLKVIGEKDGIKAENGVNGFSYNKEYVAGISIGGKQINGKIPVYKINSNEAKLWQGWGTALKPAVEYWSLVQKPFTSVPFDDIIELDGKVGIILCQLLNVKYAEKNLTLNHQDCKEGFVSALMIAVETYIKEKQEKKEKTDIFKSQEMEKMFLNIVLLWNNILAELYQETNKYTTSMSEKMITELKILNLYLQANIYQNITQAYKTKTNGNSQNVWNVVKSLCVSKIPIGDIQMLIAQENVSKKEIKNVIEKLVLFAVKFSIPEEIINIVQDNVQANQELSPNMELWTLCRKPLQGTVAQNVLKYGVGGINIDGCRVGDDEFEITNDSYDNGNNVAFGNVKRTPKKYNGRFPANFIHDGSEEVVKLFPNVGNGNGTPYSYAGVEYNNKENSMFNGDKPQAPSNYNDSGSAARFYYTAKASQTERNWGLDGFESKFTASAEFRPNHMEKAIEGESGNPYGRWQPKRNIHPTVKPIDLMRYLVRLITPKGGVCLDPFMGSGTTAVACKAEKFDYIGCELEEEYIKISEARIKAETVVYDIFDFMGDGDTSGK